MGAAGVGVGMATAVGVEGEAGMTAGWVALRDNRSSPLSKRKERKDRE